MSRGKGRTRKAEEVNLDKVKEVLRAKPTPSFLKEEDFLSTGSTLLNLACTGTTAGGYVRGRYHFLVGDTRSGKTFLSLTCLAEACKNPIFDGYRLIYDDVEGGVLLDVERFFGKKLAERLEPPGRDDLGNPVYSSTIEEFYYHVDDALNSGKPFIYILDSQDALSSLPEVDKFEEQKRAYRAGREVAGSYGDSKARIHSASLRRLMGPLRDTKSILIIVNQTRESFDVFQRTTYSGGRALLFYATLELWCSVKGSIEKVVRGKKRELGVYSKVQVRKNRVTGRDRTVVIPIYHSFGIDDVGGCIDYLIEEGFWKESNGFVEAEGLGVSRRMRRDSLVEYIEENSLEERLKELVGKVWQEIEDSCVVKRKFRYE